MRKFGIGLLLNLFLMTASIAGEFRLGSLFQDHMVLQRNMSAPVWGTAKSGDKITVEFAGQFKATEADAEGRWQVKLDPLSASLESRVLKVSAVLKSGVESIECSDVLVGEVWICSGQSNMQMRINGVPELAALVPSANNIRSFEVKRAVSFEEQDTCGGSWELTAPDSAVAFGFSYFLKEAIDVPVGIILNPWGSSSIEAWMPRDMVETVPHFKTLMDEFDADTETRNRIKGILEGTLPWSRQDDIFLRRQSSILYNAMMHPLVPYACRGLVWYQGERNTQSMFGMVKEPWYSRNSGMLKYGDTLKQWIQHYRKEWGRDDLHFLIVMLPGFGSEALTDRSWAWMRESQLKALELSHTGVANTIDLGDGKNVHPKDKLPIGQRLALLAQRGTLGMDVSAEGPAMTRVKRKGNVLIVHYDHAVGLKTLDGEAPTAFWLSDDSRRWVRAEATIKVKTVVLKSSDLAKPLYVRYAFSGKPVVNLVNKAGLPALPFRTDPFIPKP